MIIMFCFNYYSKFLKRKLQKKNGILHINKCLLTKYIHTNKKLSRNKHIKYFWIKKSIKKINNT